MAGSGQADDPPLTDRRPCALARIMPAWRALSERCWRAGVRAGLLDFAVHPVDTRRRLAVAALTYAAVVLTCTIAWQHIVRTTPPERAADPGNRTASTTAKPSPDTEGAAFFTMCERAGSATPGARQRPEHLMIAVPAGRAVLGSNADDYGSQPAELPRHEVTVAAFEIDRFEVTNEQYFDFAKASGAPPLPSWGGAPGPSSSIVWLPATGVTCAQAEAYAKWAGKRLPTEAEWVRAARGATTQTFPWGNSATQGRCNQGDAPAPVGTTAGDRSVYGVMDMGGNAAEWTADTFKPFPGCPAPPPEDPSLKVIKGGSYVERYAVARCASRRPLGSDAVEWHVGFRCVRDVPR